MPGILPMKVIKVGTNAQSRIAQACDRCRSKKIRCDGVRPCCSQCATVGFECKTSDKLSRRAFPRGYTESLEERVRVLESEVRELKELLDEKDEKIDMLSRIHSQSSHPIHQLSSPRRPSTTSLESRTATSDVTPAKDETFKVQQSPYLHNGEGSDSYFTGTSSGRTFIEAFKHKMQETGRATSIVDTDLLLSTSPKKHDDGSLTPAEPTVFKAPPRLVSDQLINIYFQEWAPLFPVLHRPAFLGLYKKYVSDSESITDKAAIAQLNLVFGIAAMSGNATLSDDIDSFEAQWKSAIDHILTDNSMPTLQALILAQMFCIQQGDLTRLLTYKGLATALSARLGLHQSQKRFALGTLTCETRKKVFWTLYTVDCFSAVTLGLPKHIKDDDIQCEYPVDADDEYVTEGGFQPNLPGESTKLSSALALFRAARILSTVLEEVYPAKASYDLSLKKLSNLSDELDAWSNSLASHLRLTFAQDKPSTGTVSSRSPLLSLTYHYIRVLINRPAVCASLGSRSSSHMIALANSSKHITQIVQLLEERGLGFSFCLKKDEVLVISGFGLLYQGLSLEPSSKILKDNCKMVNAIIGILKKNKAPCASKFDEVASSLIPVQTPAASKSSTTQTRATPIARHNSDPSLASSSAEITPASTKKQLKAIASRFTANNRTPKLNAIIDHRRATVPIISLHPQGLPTISQPSLQPPTNYNPASTSRSEPARSPLNLYSLSPSTINSRPSAPPQIKPKPRSSSSSQAQKKVLNLDYLSFGNEPEALPASGSGAHHIKPEPQPTEWEKLLGSLDNGQTNIYDACYGGQAIEVLNDSPLLGLQSKNSTATTTAESDTAQVAWDADLWALCHSESHTSANTTASHPGSGHPDSVFSFSSTDDLLDTVNPVEGDNGAFSGVDWLTIAGKGANENAFRGIVMPANSNEEETAFRGNWDVSLTL
ncbi:Hypothetical protein R9X50_00541400 [Acrodontium crateriforme]|uniref:Zn(2)-C6 fungal-type domain-containing protein n=1 Tax=Acrodontium crateriforme TaxID=150365 RepID=A0AAQ3R935_9PEZI|nr:Hypothetical protein R9X50_00541400 [Acrodontium crateriforme]